MKIRRITRRDLPVLTAMVVEFERHLARVEGKRCRIDAQKTGKSLGAAGFGRGRFFDGLLAIENGVAQGYLLYYFGFDTDHLCGTLARVPTRWNHLVEENSRKINGLSMILSQKWCPLLRIMLW